MTSILLLSRNARLHGCHQHILRSRVQARTMSISPNSSSTSSDSEPTRPPRPYQFHIGASWSGKPAEHHPLLSKNNKEQGFPSHSPIGRWRTAELNRWPAGKAGRVAGEDFFSTCEMRDSSVGERPWLLSSEKRWPCADSDHVRACHWR
jgi:hypothetical protein